jgi:hypothetical protein
MTGELEAAAVESLGDVVGKRLHRPKPGALCANCSAPLSGPFCHECGQSADDHRRSFIHLCIEMVADLFHLDGRLGRTLPDLFFRPGRLARDYFQRRMARHVPPFRMFLVTLLVFMFAAENVAHEASLAKEKAEAAHRAALATPAGRAAESARLRKEAETGRAEARAEAVKERTDDLKEGDNPPAAVEAAYQKALAAADKVYASDMAEADAAARGETGDLAQGIHIRVKEKALGKSTDMGLEAGLKKAINNPEYFFMALFNWGHRMAALMLPILGFTLALFYRRRKDLYLYDHMLVAMNLLSFQFLIFAAAMVSPEPLRKSALDLAVLWTPVNLFQTLRGAYGSSVIGGIFKTFAVWLVTVIAGTLLLTGLVLLTLSGL